jgi:hypothetical protein
MTRCNYAKSQCFCYNNNNQEYDENNDYFSDYYSNNFLSICLLNCSYNGLCRVDDLNNNSYCECNQYFTGNDCSYDLRPCSRKFNCLNGKCIDKLEIIPYDFNCECEYPWYGRHCELKINLCENITCSKQGICYSNLTLPLCKCFSGYSGTNCEIKSQEMKFIQMINNTYAVVLYVLFILLFMFIILLLERLKNGLMIQNETKSINL